MNLNSYELDLIKPKIILCTARYIVLYMRTQKAQLHTLAEHHVLPHRTSSKKLTPSNWSCLAERQTYRCLRYFSIIQTRGVEQTGALLRRGISKILLSELGIHSFVLTQRKEFLSRGKLLFRWASYYILSFWDMI